MDAILSNPLLLGLLQLLLGWYLKRNPNFANKAIPVANWLLAFFGFMAVPVAHAGALGDVGSFLGGALQAAVQAAAQTIVVTGLHGISKNVIFEWLLAGLMAKTRGTASNTSSPIPPAGA